MKTPEEKSKYQKEYKEKNKEILKLKNSVRGKIHYDNNKDKILKKQKLYRENNVEKCKKYNSNYQKVNREKRNSYMNNYIKEKRERDPIFKIKTNLRARFTEALKVKGLRKYSKTIVLIGCEIPFLRDYLESKFLPTMNWENYGKYWHIDHIKPCTLFDLSKKEEQLKCFHYTNLQPLFAVTQIIDGIEYIGNINKSNKYEI